METTSSRLGFAALIFGAGCIGFAPILVRLSEIGPVATGFHRLLWSLPVFALVVAWQRRPLPGEATAWGGMAASGFFFAADLTVWHLGIWLTTIANATLFSNTAPVFVAIGAWLVWGLAPNRRFLAALVVAMAGAALLVGSSFRLSLDRVAGDGLSLLSGAFYGAYILSVGRLRARLSMPLVMLAGGAAGSVVAFAAALALGESIWPETARGWAVVVGLALLGQVAGQGLIAWGLAHVPSTLGAVVLLVQPVVAAAVAWILFGERLGAMELTGGLVVLFGIHLARRSLRA
ncbi:MAG: DMT family transporter [Alphaproteobacteria bacterium]|nr:DMT family transporter [Alphaproteobacteria bacterium]